MLTNFNIILPLPPLTFIYFELYAEKYKKVFNLIAEVDKNPIFLYYNERANRIGIITFAL